MEVALALPVARQRPAGPQYGSWLPAARCPTTDPFLNRPGIQCPRLGAQDSQAQSC